MKAKLSMAFENMRGKTGALTVQGGVTGLRVKSNSPVRNPKTAAQQQVRQNLSRATEVFKTLTQAQFDQWKAYAQAHPRTDPVTGQTYVLAPSAIYNGLAAKLLQMNANATIPATPPVSPFGGDGVTFQATAGAGKITFTASRANTLGVTTEILLQPLKSPFRTPSSSAYRTKDFNVFGPVLTLDVNVPPGYYAAAYRFVRIATGQASDTIPIGISQVTLSLEETEDQAA